MKKYWIKNLSDKQAIHAPTKEIDIKLRQKFNELGLKWLNGSSYMETEDWEIYKNITCYLPFLGQYSSFDYYHRQNYEIISIEQLLDFDEPLKIEVGKFYKTRAGNKVRIYAVECRGEFPIHGAILSGISSVGWVPETWELDGRFIGDFAKYNYEEDIVEEWIDEIEFDIESLPTFKYIARGLNGEWCAYIGKPSQGETIWYGSNLVKIRENNYPKNYNGSWEDSLHEIIDGKLVKVV